MPIRKEHDGIFFTNFFPNTNIDEINFEKKYLYPRGFLICKNNILNKTEYYTKYNFDNEFYIYYHFLLDFTHYEYRNCRIAILGKAYYLKFGQFNPNISEMLCKLLYKNKILFFEELNYIGGRYCILIKDSSGTFVIGDTQMFKTVFYHKDKSCCSSHIELLNTICNEPYSEIENLFKNKNIQVSYDYPGNTTKYKDIYILPANFCLDIKNGYLKRFWPIKNKEIGLSDNSIYSVRTNILNKFYTQIDNLGRKYRLLMSLTGGKDSRVSFFSAQNLINKMYFFTASRDCDIPLAFPIAKKYDLNFLGIDARDLHINDNLIYKKFKKVVIDNIFPKSCIYALSPEANFSFLNFFGVDNYLHINSQGAETGRGYPRFNLPANTFNFDKFYDNYIYYATKWTKNANLEIEKLKNEPIIKEILYNWYKFLNYDDIKEKGYNPYLLSYQETRMSNMLSEIHMCSDISYDSLSLVSTRDILLDFWKIDEKYMNNNIDILYDSILKELDERENKFEDYDFNHKKVQDIFYAKELLIKYYFNIREYKKCIDSSKLLLDSGITNEDIYIFDFIILLYRKF